MSLGGGIKNNEENNIVNTQISERTEGEDTGTLFQIIFIEGWGRRIFGGSVEGGAIFCMPLVEKCNTESHTQEIGSVYDIPGGNKRVCVVMDLSAPHLPSSAFFQLVLIGATVSNVKSFEGLPL